MPSDLHHTLELINRYYPDNPFKPTIKPNSTTPEYAPTPPRTPTRHSIPIPYICCNITYTDNSQALSHFFDVHFEAAIAAIDTNPCRCFNDIGNPAIPIIQRVDYFIASLNTRPNNPSHFRPAPISLPPLKFKNPYSATMAMAYDILQTLSDRPPEYANFTSLVDFHASLSNIPQYQVNYWLCWAHYLHPSLNAPSKDVRCEIQPLFHCEVPGCTKLYKQITGLQYHLSKAHNDPTITINDNALKCPFTPCDKTYQSSTGLRNHLKKFHLQPHHFEQDIHTKHTPATCPILPCTNKFPSLAALRIHIINTHFWSITHMRRFPQ
ncbi:hypothetical protein DSO57_1021329 [Entomophthora muscae]|uniref:Uncharacterized protein n=2 Tax=Entomophthora muscae TaxID=34485 RepID=A0ACC2SUD3_9FUNG|nr:hypothetical protein DSO57_1014051 [Entomophthora muscae]KAJ9080782.1 hypothetical protein DSO57_1021329 [Entomophthora muscae]